MYFKVTHKEWKESRCSPLPLEVWECIIAQIDSNYHPRTWLNIRRVSHLLKAATEHVFAAEHLSQSWIEFRPLILREPFLARTPKAVEIQLSFEGLSGDGSRAMFASKKGFDNLKDMQMPSYAQGNTKTVYDTFMHRWHESARPYTQPCPTVEDVCFPNHCFVLHREVNDTELPGVKFDLERVTVSFLWKPMLSIFYGEIEYRKWASKVMYQHVAHTGEFLMRHAMFVGEVYGERNLRQLQKLETDTIDKIEDGKIEITSIIRTMRFKRMLGKIDYQEKGQAIPNDRFKEAGMATFVDSVKYALEWDRGDDEDTSDNIEERGRGCFYDGMGMKFDGRGELNEPSIASDHDEEWEDEDD